DSGYLAMTSSNSSEPFGVSPVCEPTIWHSEDGHDWAPSGSPLDRRGVVYDLAWRDGRFVAVGGLDVADPAAWTSTDGLEWESLLPGESWGEVDLVAVEAGRGAGVVWRSVEALFGSPGVGTLPVYDAFLDRPQLRHVEVRHEQGAVFMADGYSR